MGCVSLFPFFINYARKRIFTDPYSPIERQNRRFCLYRGKHRSGKPIFLHILRSEKLEKGQMKVEPFYAQSFSFLIFSDSQESSRYECGYYIY